MMALFASRGMKSPILRNTYKHQPRRVLGFSTLFIGKTLKSEFGNPEKGERKNSIVKVVTEGF